MTFNEFIQAIIEEYCPDMKAPYCVKAIVAFIKSGIRFYGDNPIDLLALIVSLVSLGVASGVLAAVTLLPPPTP